MDLGWCDHSQERRWWRIFSLSHSLAIGPRLKTSFWLLGKYQNSCWAFSRFPAGMKVQYWPKRIFFFCFVFFSAIIRRWFDSEILAGTVGSSRHPRRTGVEQSRALGIENKFEKIEKKNRRAVRQQLSEMASRLSPVFCQICFPLHMDRHSTKRLAHSPFNRNTFYTSPCPWIFPLPRLEYVGHGRIKTSGRINKKLKSPLTSCCCCCCLFSWHTDQRVE